MGTVGKRMNGSREQLWLRTTCTECGASPQCRIYTLVSIYKVQNAFISQCTRSGPKIWPVRSCNNSRVKSAIEMSSSHAQPNKTWNCNQEVSGTALQIITVFVINSVFFPFPVCLSAICWTLRHKIGWLCVAGRGWLGWCLGDKALGAAVRNCQ